MKKNYTLYLSVEMMDNIRELAKSGKRSMNTMIEILLEKNISTSKDESIPHVHKEDVALPDDSIDAQIEAIQRQIDEQDAIKKAHHFSSQECINAIKLKTELVAQLGMKQKEKKLNTKQL